MSTFRTIHGMTCALRKAGQHVFLSYPSVHRPIAEHLARLLRNAGFQVWLDAESIEAGTRDWERSVRDGVKNAFAVVLLCSPETIESHYVQAEIKLAETLGCTILPIWVLGNHWVDSVPLGLINSQYVDCRDNQFGDGIGKLVARLTAILTDDAPPLFMVDSPEECPPGFIRIILTENSGDTLDSSHLASPSDRIQDPRQPVRAAKPKQRIFVANPSAYDSFERLLDDLYTGYLHQRYPVYSYGRDWVLARVSPLMSVFALPLEWLRYQRERSLVEALVDYRERSTPLQTFGLDKPSHDWHIVDGDFEVTLGMCTTNELIAKALLELPEKQTYFLLSSWIKTSYGLDWKSEQTTGKSQTSLYRFPEYDICRSRYGLDEVEIRRFSLDDLEPHRMPYQFVLYDQHLDSKFRHQFGGLAPDQRVLRIE